MIIIMLRRSQKNIWEWEVNGKFAAEKFTSRKIHYGKIRRWENSLRENSMLGKFTKGKFAAEKVRRWVNSPR